jgi:hypothetical protein
MARNNGLVPPLDRAVPNHPSAWPTGKDASQVQASVFLYDQNEFAPVLP